MHEQGLNNYECIEACKREIKIYFFSQMMSICDTQAHIMDRLQFIRVNARGVSAKNKPNAQAHQSIAKGICLSGWLGKLNSAKVEARVLKC